MNKFTKVSTVLSVVLAGFLGGCVSNGDVGTGSGVTVSDMPYNFSQFTDIPVPQKAEMDLTGTSIVGREADWMGKISFATPYSVGGVFDFYTYEMPKFGWKELTSVRGIQSVLVFVRGARIALVQISPAPFVGSEVLFNVGPLPRGKKMFFQDRTDLKPVNREVQPRKNVGHDVVEAKEVVEPMANTDVTNTENLDY